MRVILLLLVAVSVCVLLGNRVFGNGKAPVLEKLFYTLALILAVILVYIVFLGLIQGQSLFT